MIATLADLRASLGASGVADAIRRALAAHTTITAAAASLGTTPSNLRRAARRVGVALPTMPGTPGSAGGRRAKTAAKQGRGGNRTKDVDTRSDRI